MNWDILSPANHLWFELPGYTLQSGVLKPSAHHIWFDSLGVNLGSAYYYFQEFNDEISGMDTDLSDWA